MKSKKLLSILCLLALTACGSNTSSTDNSSTQQESTSVAPSSEVLSNSSTTAESSSSDVSSEISSEVSSEVSSDTSSEVSSDTSSDISSEVSSEVSSDTSSDISSEVSSEVSSETSSDTSSEVSSETSSDTSSEVSSEEAKPVTNIADALEAENGTEVILTGTVTSIYDHWNPGYNNMSVNITDEEGKTILVYRIKTKVSVGDKITVNGKISAYNSVNQVIEASVEVLETATFTEKTISEALEAADGTLVSVTGIVSNIDYAWNAKYCNMSVTIIDNSGNSLYAYKLGTKVAFGDNITIKGAIGSHNGKKQLVSATAEINTFETTTLKTLIENGTKGTLVEASRVYNTGSSKTTYNSSFYNGVYYGTAKQESKTYDYETGSYSEDFNEVSQNYVYYNSIYNNRYYEVSENLVNNTKSVKGYGINENPVNSYLEVTEETAKNNTSKIWGTNTNNISSFGNGSSASVIALSHLNHFNQYSDKVFNPTLTSTTENNSLLVNYSYDYVYDYYGSMKAYVQSSTYEFNSNGELVAISFTQEDFSQSYDTEKEEIPSDAVATSSYKWDYEFTYGSLTNEETSAYNISDLLYSSFEVKAYSDYSCTNEISATNPANVGENVYFKFIGTPDTITTDSIVVKANSNSNVANCSIGRQADSAYIMSAGETTITFISAGGYEASVTFSAQAPNPEDVIVPSYNPVVEALGVNDTYYLPECYIEPDTADQSFAWKLVEGSEYATLTKDDRGWCITTTAMGTIKVQAYSTIDETVCSEIYTIVIASPLSAEELNSFIVSENGYYTYLWGQQVNIKFNNDGTGFADCGKELVWTETGRKSTETNTTFTFSWTLDASTGNITLNNIVWTFAEELESNYDSSWFSYSSYYTQSATIDRFTGKMYFYFSQYEDACELIAIPTSDEIKASLTEKQYYYAFLEGSYYLSAKFNSDGSGKLYYYYWDTETQEDVFCELSDFTYTFDVETMTITLSVNEFTINEINYTFTIGTLTVVGFDAGSISVPITDASGSWSTGLSNN